MKILKIVAGILLLALGTPANAALTVFVTHTGNVAVSTDGWGDLSNVGVISASVPAGATVLAAYLYSATYSTGANIPGVTLNGMAATFGPKIANTTACCDLASFRADVTSIVAPIIDGGPGGVYDFDITENRFNIDGEALVVIYELASLPEATVGILDGFASVTGDMTSINFADPLDPSDPGFFAEMSLGIGFSCCSQRSSVDVNGITITDNAGNFDDGEGGGAANGRLITVGGFDDGFSPFLPTYADDTERYDLSGQVMMGDTSIVVNTINGSQDDNIFLAAFYVAGIAAIDMPPNDVPEPGTLALFGAGLMLLAFRRRRRA